MLNATWIDKDLTWFQHGYGSEPDELSGFGKCTRTRHVCSLGKSSLGEVSNNDCTFTMPDVSLYLALLWVQDHQSFQFECWLVKCRRRTEWWGKIKRKKKRKREKEEFFLLNLTFYLTTNSPLIRILPSLCHPLVLNKRKKGARVVLLWTWVLMWLLLQWPCFVF